MVKATFKVANLPFIAEPSPYQQTAISESIFFHIQFAWPRFSRRYVEQIPLVGLGNVIPLMDYSYLKLVHSVHSVIFCHTVPWGGGEGQTNLHCQSGYILRYSIYPSMVYLWQLGKCARCRMIE